MEQARMEQARTEQARMEQARTEQTLILLCKLGLIFRAKFPLVPIFREYSLDILTTWFRYTLCGFAFWFDFYSHVHAHFCSNLIVI